MNGPTFSKIACVVLYRRFISSSCLNMCDTHEIARSDNVHLQSVQTSERLRECLRQSSLLLPYTTPYMNRDCD
jgi:hypothetical protein